MAYMARLPAWRLQRHASCRTFLTLSPTPPCQHGPTPTRTRRQCLPSGLVGFGNLFLGEASEALACRSWCRLMEYTETW